MIILFTYFCSGILRLNYCKVTRSIRSYFRFGLNLFSWYRVVQSGLYFVQSLLAYTLMLIAMTFNVWIILGIVFGEAVGYFLFFE
ncbi:unnamed protein product [Thelazia callipaeda]|uniref:Copper transport protein n=1 Tax=Thelazia callipaeda TaxID=103827 RepID=A0A3P7N450_THECL|nr:unnamed protein product [Thelazia callipaeda]